MKLYLFSFVLLYCSLLNAQNPPPQNQQCPIAGVPCGPIAPVVPGAVPGQLGTGNTAQPSNPNPNNANPNSAFPPGYQVPLDIKACEQKKLNDDCTYSVEEKKYDGKCEESKSEDKHLFCVAPSSPSSTNTISASYTLKLSDFFQLHSPVDPREVPGTYVSGLTTNHDQFGAGFGYVYRSQQPSSLRLALEMPSIYGAKPTARTGSTYHSYLPLSLNLDFVKRNPDTSSTISVVPSKVELSAARYQINPDDRHKILLTFASFFYREYYAGNHATMTGMRLVDFDYYPEFDIAEIGKCQNTPCKISVVFHVGADVGAGFVHPGEGVGYNPINNTTFALTTSGRIAGGIALKGNFMVTYKYDVTYIPRVGSSESSTTDNVRSFNSYTQSNHGPELTWWFLNRRCIRYVDSERQENDKNCPSNDLQGVLNLSYTLETKGSTNFNNPSPGYVPNSRNEHVLSVHGILYFY